MNFNLVVIVFPGPKNVKLLLHSLNDIVKRTILILSYDERAAEWHAKERARLSSKGLISSFVDGQIAAISVVTDLILVTRNIDDFKQFRRLEIRNWHT